ncbi:hypothetical protein GCM10027068_12770 [Prescottella soli]
MTLRVWLEGSGSAPASESDCPSYPFGGKMRCRAEDGTIPYSGGDSSVEAGVTPRVVMEAGGMEAGVHGVD